jgi:crotonobetainyl-CoA:carnitine CoA-transferase CaiB-like acyl-CoA transferase/alkylhydroperoxidase family enzyme
MRPLEGIRILTVEEYGAGPFATQLLADLGVEVIKIENPARGGDSSRHVPPHNVGTDSLFFESLNRGKQSVLLDLKSEHDRGTFHRLVARSDGVVNNLRTTTASALGLRYADLSAVNPRVVCCSASGWGDGPRAGDPAYDYLVQAYVGNMAVTGEPDSPPARSAVPWVDTSTGFAAAFGLLAGIRAAERTGKGCDVDVSMVDVAMSEWMYMATWYLTAGTVQQRAPLSRHASVVPSQLFETSDGHLVVMAQTQAFWRALCTALGLAELTDDERFHDMASRNANRDELLALLAPIFRTRESDEWIDVLGDVVPVGKVRGFAEAMETFAAEQPDRILEWDHPTLGHVRTIGCPVRVSGAERRAVRAPQLGEHDAEVPALLDERAARAPRIEPVSEPSAEEADVLAATVPIPGAQPPNLFRTLVRHPTLAKRTNLLAGMFLTKGLLPPRDRELAILRVAALAHSEYELRQHRRLARGVGLGEDEIDAAIAGEAPRPLLAFVEAVANDVDASDELWQPLADVYTDEQMLELVLLVGFYRMIAGALNTVGVPLDDDVVAAGE